MARKKDDAAEGAEEDEKGGGGLAGKLKLVAMVLPTVLLIAGAVYFFVFAGSGGDTTAKSKSSSSAKATSEDDGTGEDGAEPTSTWIAGKLVTIDPVTINLANGHYLKVGVALQATADAGEEVNGAKAIDALIAQFSGKTVDELATQAGRDAAKKALVKQLKKVYEKKVYDLFWTTFVMN